MTALQQLEAGFGIFCCSVTKSCATLCNTMDCRHQASLSFTFSQSLLKLMSIESVMSSNHLILCHPLLLLPFNLSQHQGLFQWVYSSHEVAKVLGLQLQHQSFQRIFRLTSFRMDWFDLLAVQGTLKSLFPAPQSTYSICSINAY